MVRPRSATRSIPKYYESSEEDIKTNKNNSDKFFKKVDVKESINTPRKTAVESRSETSIIRIRDPITSKVKTLYLNDSQIDELSKRHEQDKTKVNSYVQNNSNLNNNKGLNNNISLNDNINLNVNNNKTSQLVPKPKKPVDLGRSKIMEEYEKQESVSNEEEEKFRKLLERHNKDKQIVNDFAITDSQIINQKVESNSNEITA